MVVDGDERGGGRVIKIRRAAGINALRKYKCTNSYGDMSLSQSLPNGRFEIPNGDKATRLCWPRQPCCIHHVIISITATKYNSYIQTLTSCYIFFSREAGKVSTR